MSKLTCDVVFVECVKYGHISTFNQEVGEPIAEWAEKEYVEVGRSTVTVDLKEDITPEKIEALKAEKERLGIEAQMKMNNIDEQIQSLLSIEHKQ